MANKTNSKVGKYQYYRLQHRTGEFTVDRNGFKRPVVKNFYGKSKVDAERKRDKWIAEHQTAEELTFSAEMDYFIDHVMSSDNSIKASTRRLYINAWRNNFVSQRFLGQKVSQVTGKQLQAALDDLDVATGTKKAAVKLLRRFYDYESTENDLPDRSQHLHIKQDTPMDAQEKEIWRDAELTAILHTLEGHRLRFLVILALNTGCRISELLGLKYSDFTEETLSINRQVIQTEGENGNLTLSTGLPKSKDSIRQIPINNTVKAALAVHKEWHIAEQQANGYSTQFVFTTSTGRLCDRRNIHHALKRVYRDAGVTPRRFHCYRKTFASKLAEAGTSPAVLASLLGHSDPRVAYQYYIHIPDHQKAAAVSILDSEIIAKNLDTRI